MSNTFCCIKFDQKAIIFNIASENQILPFNKSIKITWGDAKLKVYLLGTNSVGYFSTCVRFTWNVSSSSGWLSCKT